ncbi:MAG: indole-3-glycerol phosphate synthase TrpC [Thermoleophilaceae bacterium]
MSVRLEAIVSATRRRLAEQKRERPVAALERAAAMREERRDFRGALERDGIALIAEHKRRSPSAGVIRAGSGVADIASAYEAGGAAALSVLTERDHFDGSLADLEEARAACALPILRKDFTVDSYQLLEAVAHGADAVLLVVGALDQETLERLHVEALELGLAALVEVHDEPELERALAARAELIGVNNRNLTDFSVDLARTFDLFDRIPSAITVISESGIKTPQHVADLAAIGVDAVLIGETLMRAMDPGAAIRGLLEGLADAGTAGEPQQAAP